jgi:hypothetical protein
MAGMRRGRLTAMVVRSRALVRGEVVGRWKMATSFGWAGRPKLGWFFFNAFFFLFPDSIYLS